MMDVCFHNASSPTGYSLTGSASGEISEEGGEATEVAPDSDREANGSWSSPDGIMAAPFHLAPHCKCGPVARLVAPTFPMICPACMRSPSFTRTSERWKYIL